MATEAPTKDKQTMKKKVVIPVAAVAVAAVAMGGVTYSAWHSGFTFGGNGTFSLVQATLSATAGTGQQANSTYVQSPVTATFADGDLLTPLVNTTQAAAPVTVTGFASSSVAEDLSLTGVQATDLFASDLTTVNIYLMDDPSQSTSSPATCDINYGTGGSAGATQLYTGVAKNATFAARPLIPAGTTQDTTTSIKLCVVMNSNVTVTPYNQTATATADSADGGATATSTWGANVMGVAADTGNYGLTFGWTIHR